MYVRVSLAPVEFRLTEEVMAICGASVSMVGWEPVVMDPV